MKVIGINSFPYIPQINTRHKAEQTNPIQVNFTGIDRFERSATTSFRQEIKKVYTKLGKDMGILQPSDISKIVSNIITKTGLSKEEVLKSLDILTQYSSYRSLNKIENELYRKSCYSIKSLPTDHSLFENRGICLADVLKYISMKNFRYSQNDSSNVIIVDSKMLNFLDKTGINCNRFFTPHNTIYIENFENGYNFLNQSQPLEDFTIEKLNKALQLQKRNGKDLSYDLKYVLNGSILRKLHKHAIDFQIIKSNLAEFPTEKDIVQNINPIFPDFDYFYVTAKDIARNGELSKKENEEFVLDFLNNLTEIVTPRSYCEYLKILNTKIENFIKQNNRDPKKIYYIIPNTEKSFALTNYMHQNTNNAKTQNIILNQKLNTYDTLDKIENLPKGSTLILMDDYLISGLSMLKEQFCYDEILKSTTILQKDNKRIIFAPMFATKCGSKEFSNFMKFFNRFGIDEIVPAKILPEYKEKYIFNSKRKYNQFQTSSVLPYMGPDTNAKELIPIYDLFLYNPNAQKSCIDNIGDIYDSLY